MRRPAIAPAALLAALLVTLSAACGSRPAPRTAPAPAAPPPVAAKAPARDPSDPSPWPCAMRALTWTPEGLAAIGEVQAARLVYALLKERYPAR